MTGGNLKFLCIDNRYRGYMHSLHGFESKIGISFLYTSSHGILCMTKGK